MGRSLRRPGHGQASHTSSELEPSWRIGQVGKGLSEPKSSSNIGAFRAPCVLS